MDTPEGLLEALTTANVVEPTAGDLDLTDRFWAAWERRIKRLRGDRETLQSHLAGILGVEPTAVSLHGEAPVEAHIEDQRVAHWPSLAAATADIALVPLLAAWYDPWREYDDQTRLEVVARLRAFLRACPSCATPLEPTPPAAGLTCTGCGATIHRPVDEQDRF